MTTHSLQSLFVAIFVSIVSIFGVGTSPAFAQNCFSNGDARQAVANGLAAPLSSFVGRLRSMGQVVSSCLARRGGRLVYIVSIVQSNGQVTQVVMDAKTGQF